MTELRQRDMRIMRMPQLENYVGLCRSSIYRMIKTGSFPRPIRLGERAIGFRKCDIDAWVQAREECSDA